MTISLIALTGRAHAGKDTCASVLVGQGWARKAFADPLKTVTAYVADEDERLYHDPATKEDFSPSLGMTRRAALQLLGTEGFRNTLGPDVWSRRLIRRWLLDGKPKTVISDCRFDNEALAVREAGGIVVGVLRPSLSGAVGVQGHASEQGVSPSLVDMWIVNDGTVDDLLRSFSEQMDRYVQGAV